MAVTGVPVIGGPLVRPFRDCPPVGVAGGFRDQELWIDAVALAPTLKSAYDFLTPAKAAAGSSVTHSAGAPLGRRPMASCRRQESLRGLCSFRRTLRRECCLLRCISGIGSATRFASLPGVMLPTSASRPSASAPLSVPMRSISVESSRVTPHHEIAFRPTSSNPGFDARLSVPSATRTPAANHAEIEGRADG